MLLKPAFLFLCMVYSTVSFGQEYADSIELEEVRIYGIPLSHYSIGSKINKIDSATIAGSLNYSLSELISRKTPIYFKDYGSGMLSTIAFRGTSSNHTAVLWNGLNINQPTHGQSDFSLLPVYAFQQIDIQPGPASTLYGSGAVGGSIHLYHKPDWKDHSEISLNQGIGSYSRYFTGLSTHFSNQNFESLTKIYIQNQENDFPFLKSSGERERQQNAFVKKYGLVQEFNYRLASNQYLSFSGWYNYTDREIQPTKNNNLNEAQYTDQVDNSLRLSADYHHNSKAGYFNVKLAYLRDFLNYNNVSDYLTEQYISSISYEKSFNKRISYTVGAKFNHTRADVAQYHDFSSENRFDIYSALKYQVLKTWKISVSARKSIVEGYKAPLVPSLGSEVTIVSNYRHSLELRALAGKSFRLPTLNERFWISGDPEIRPEKGYNLETGLDYSFKKPTWKAHSSLTYYAMWIDDWILWQPGVPEWYPENIKEVRFTGIEWSADISVPYSGGKLVAGGSYALSRAINQTALSEYSKAVGKQLPYSPKHSGVFYTDFLWKTWQASIGLSATGKRYTGDDNVDYLNPYALLNVGLNKQINLKENALLIIAVKANNLLDTRFETYQNRAMPGINYEASLKLNWSKKP